MTKTNKEIKENTIEISFEDEGLAVKGNVSKTKQVQGVLAMISALIDRCGGDAEPVNDAIRAIKKASAKEKKEESSVKHEVHEFKSLEDLAKFFMDKIEEKGQKEEESEDEE